MPAARPEIEAVYHADFSPMTTDKPAVEGETLITLCTGLGPTLPDLTPVSRSQRIRLTRCIK